MLIQKKKKEINGFNYLQKTLCIVCQCINSVRCKQMYNVIWSFFEQITIIINKWKTKNKNFWMICTVLLCCRANIRANTLNSSLFNHHIEWKKEVKKNTNSNTREFENRKREEQKRKMNGKKVKCKNYHNLDALFNRWYYTRFFFVRRRA